MGRSVSWVLAVVLGSVTMGCSPESKAKRALETYETVFRSCKLETDRAKMKPGEHECSGIASSALDLGLQQTGVEEAKKQELLTSWLEKKQFVGYYVPSEKRSVKGLQ